MYWKPDGTGRSRGRPADILIVKVKGSMVLRGQKFGSQKIKNSVIYYKICY